MIRNIVFDLGNVLISFRPAEYISHNGYSALQQKLILSDVFGSPEWALLDDGIITVPEAIRSISAKSSLKTAEITRIFNDRMKIFYSLDNNIKLLPELKEQGYRLYYISNFHADLFDEVSEKYSFFSYFDGGIVSAFVRHSKPDPEIFRIFLETYNLSPGECMFIDDSKNNVDGAILSGMKGFDTNGSDDIREEFKKFLKSCF